MVYAKVRITRRKMNEAHTLGLQIKQCRHKSEEVISAMAYKKRTSQ